MINHQFILKEFTIFGCAAALLTIVIANASGAGAKGALGNRDTEKQVEALLSQMTLDEKIGQMVQVDSDALTNKSDIQTYLIGSVLSGGDSDPPGHDNSIQSWLTYATNFEAYALQTRLKIPLIYGIDAVHGHNNIVGTVIFPHNIGMGATHDPRIVEQ